MSEELGFQKRLVPLTSLKNTRVQEKKKRFENSNTIHAHYVT